MATVEFKKGKKSQNLFGLAFCSEMASQNSNNNDYIRKLEEEKKKINPQNALTLKVLQQEIERVRNQGNDAQRNDSHVVVHTGKQIRLKVKVHIPVEEHPNFNFVGKLLGPKGSSLQQLQEATQTRMAILGKGSMRDKRKEDELRAQGDPKYSHLNEQLHVEVSALAPPPEAYRRVSVAFVELQRFLVPEAPGPYAEQDYYDDMHQPQYMNEGGKKPPPPYQGESPRMAPRSMPPRPMGPPLMQGREPPRRVQSSYPAQEQDEWGAAPPPRPAPRRGGYSAPAPPQARPPPQRSYEEPANDYNNYGDGYEYNSGNSSGYYDYAAEPEPAYADGYAEEPPRAPMRTAPAPRGRNNARVSNHPYAGATRRGY